MLSVLAVTAVVLVAGCRYALPAASTPVPSPVQGRVAGAVQCTANVTTGQVGCRKARVEQEPAITDTIPRGFLISNDSVMKLYAPARLILSGSRFAGPYPPDVVLLQFRPTATLAEKQAALDMVRGSVIGGGWGSFYYLQVPNDDNPDGGAQTAIDRLVTLPQVQRAMPDITIGMVPFSGRPCDAPAGGRRIGRSMRGSAPPPAGRPRDR